MNDVKNSLSTFIAQRPSLNLETPRYLSVLRRSIWNELFYILWFKEIKKQGGPRWCWINAHLCTNIFFKNHITNNENAFIYQERNGIGKSLFAEVSLGSLKCLIDRCFRKFNGFSDFRFEDKPSRDTFKRSLYGMIVYRSESRDFEKNEWLLYFGHYGRPTKKMVGMRWFEKAALETISFWRNILISIFKFSPVFI